MPATYCLNDVPIPKKSLRLLSCHGERRDDATGSDVLDGKQENHWPRMETETGA